MSKSHIELHQIYLWKKKKCWIWAYNLCLHRASIIVMVTSFIEVGPPLDASEFGFLDWNMNAGFFGEGRVVSLPNMKTTSNMVGRSVEHSCTHSSPIWMHFETLSSGYDWPRDGSTISNARPSLHMYQIWCNVEHHFRPSIQMYRIGKWSIAYIFENIVYFILFLSNLGWDFQDCNQCFSCH